MGGGTHQEPLVVASALDDELEDTPGLVLASVLVESSVVVEESSVVVDVLVDVELSEVDPASVVVADVDASVLSTSETPIRPVSPNELASAVATTA